MESNGRNMFSYQQPTIKHKEEQSNEKRASGKMRITVQSGSRLKYQAKTNRG